MIAALALIGMAAQQAPAPEALTEDEIVVIGRRLEAIAVSVGRDGKGRYHCAMKGSTGRATLDDRLCRAVTACVRKGAQRDSQVAACVAKAKPRLLADLRRARK